MRPGMLPVAQHHLAVHDRGVEAGGLLAQAPGARGQVVHHLGHVGRYAVGIEDDHVGGWTKNALRSCSSATWIRASTGSTPRSRAISAMDRCGPHGSYINMIHS